VSASRRGEAAKAGTRAKGRAASGSEGGYLVAKAQQIGGRIFNRLLREAGGGDINSAQGRILFALWKGGGMSISALSRETALEPSTLTSMLDRLEAAGLLMREPSPEDRRAFLVACTAKGRSLEAKYASVSKRMTELFYGHMSASEVEAFESAMRRIVGNLAAAELRLK
jgi:DNA-binding MarR family transcriptional regulator